MTSPRERRPVGPARIVMLVDNGVNGDSRVQKTAHSAAEAGWDVILLGRAMNGVPQTWRLGPAQVRLLRMPSPLKAKSHEFRRHWLIAPLAYPPTGVAAYRAQKVRARLADLQTRRALLAVAKPGLGTSIRGVLLGARIRVTGIRRRWVSLRYWLLNRARNYRDGLTSPWDRAYTWFWSRVRGHGSWRALDPQLWDFELAFGPVVDELSPDIIYANDFRMLGVGARAKIRARARGREVKLIWDVHEYLPGVTPRVANARWMVANVAHEREYAPYADAVLAVSDRLARMMQRDYSLSETPSVVLNAPRASDVLGARGPESPSIRAVCGIDAATPLIVYSGAAAPQRGLAVMVEAMPALEEAHVAFVVPDLTNPYVRGLVARAEDLGVARRLHVLPYVAHSDVVGFLSAATVGVIPIHHWLNHEIALITKFFEYSHARVPIVVSDVETMAATVRDTGQGEVFRADDVDDYVRAVRLVIADPQRYRRSYESIDLDAWVWEAQATVQDRIYRGLVPADGGTTRE